MKEDKAFMPVQTQPRDLSHDTVDIEAFVAGLTDAWNRGDAWSHIAMGVLRLRSEMTGRGFDKLSSGHIQRWH
jgi:hypothetical protein